MKFTVEHISNMIFISDEGGHVWRAWDDREFTERKLKNAEKKIQGCFNYPVSFTRTF